MHLFLAIKIIIGSIAVTSEAQPPEKQTALGQTLPQLIQMASMPQQAPRSRCAPQLQTFLNSIWKDVHLHAVKAGTTTTFCPVPQFGSEAELFEI